MTTASHGKGINKDTGFKSVSDFTYKGNVLENLNATKSIMTAAAQSGFEKSMVLSVYLATSSLAKMILPFVSDNSTLFYAQANKNRILENLEILSNEFAEVKNSDFTERAEYVKRCEEVIGDLIPLLSFIGLYVKVTSVGVFKVPEKEDKDVK
jgi:hypothetical protein